MSTGFDLAIDSNLAAVQTAARAVRAACAGLLPTEVIDEIEIAVVEAINNVIAHGYGGRPGHEIRLRLCLQPEKVVIEIIDRARPMAPGLFAALPEDPFRSDVTDRTSLAESGRGLALIQVTMDEVAYGSEGGENRLRLTKHRRVP
jgi:serine/threonine-protein kinase RsbW